MWQTIIIYLARTWSSSHQLTSFDLVQLDDAGDTIFSAKLAHAQTAIGVWCYDLTFLLRSSFQAFALRAQAAKYTQAQINQKWVTWCVQSKNEKLQWSIKKTINYRWTNYVSQSLRLDLYVTHINSLIAILIYLIMSKYLCRISHFKIG